MDTQPASTKKPLLKRWWFWAIVIFFAVGIGVASDDPPQIGESTPTTAATYQEVFAFSGNGTKKSEPFTITGSRFKIKYECAGNYCGATLYKVGKTLQEGSIMNTTEAIKDETIFYGSGEYYIDANTLGQFSMTVEDYR